MSDDDQGALEPLPTPNARDRLQDAARIGMSAVPYVGGPAAELIDVVIRPSLERRRDRWFQALADVVEDLRNHSIRPEDLADDERFVTAVAEASRIALGTHIEEKIEMLKRVLEHAAIDHDTPDFMVVRYLRFVEELAPEHVLLLRYAVNPRRWYEEHGLEQPQFMAGSPRAVLDGAHVPIGDQIREVALRDLGDRGLADSGSFGTTMTNEGAWQTWATDLGRDFLAFLEEL